MVNNKDNILLESLSRVEMGDHLCLIYSTFQEQLNAAIPFIRIGLQKHEKCIYVADDNTVDVIRTKFKEMGNDVFARALDNGSLVLLTKDQSYLKDGYFDPDKMISFIEAGVIDSLANGYTGLRVLGEMTWILSRAEETNKLIEYESKLNILLKRVKVCAICQYNKNRFSNDVLIDVLRTHPIVIYKDRVIRNPVFIRPDEMAVQRTYGDIMSTFKRMESPEFAF